MYNENFRMSITRPKGVRTEKLQVKADTLRKERGEITLNQRHKSQKKKEKKTQKLEQITNHDKKSKCILFTRNRI